MSDFNTGDLMPGTFDQIVRAAKQHETSSLHAIARLEAIALLHSMSRTHPGLFIDRADLAQILAAHPDLAVKPIQGGRAS